MRLVNRLRSRRCVSLTVGIAAAAALTVAVAPAGSAAEAAEFAPADEATVTPGVMTRTEGAQCTANFVFTDGTDVFLGQAAHCAGTGASTETDGCTAGSLPLGTPATPAPRSRRRSAATSKWWAEHDGWMRWGPKCCT